MLHIFLYVALVLYLVHALLAVSFPFPLDYGEAPLVDQAMRLASSQNIYRPDLSSPPYTVANYPPLYPLVLAPFVALFDPNFLAGRAISILSALLSATFLALIIYTHSKDRLAALSTGLIFLAVPYVVHWSGLARVDLLALGLSLAALYLLVRRPTARWSTIGAGLLLVAAIYTRQNYILAALLAALVWLWTHERRRAIELALLVGGLSLLLFLSLNLATGGGFFLNTVTANFNQFFLARLNQSLIDLSATAPLLLLLSLLFLFSARQTSLWPLLAPYLLGAFLSTLLIGKTGSNMNYFLELMAALSLVAGAAISWSRRYPWRRAALLILLALQVGLLIQATLTEAFDRRLTVRRSDRGALADLSRMVAEADGPVLADEYMGLVTLHKQPLYLQPFEMTQLAQAGQWDQTALLDAIKNRTFPLILIHHLPFSFLHQARWTPEMLSSIEQNYTPFRMQAGTVVYRPQAGDTPSVTQLLIPQNNFSPDTLQVGPLRRISQAPYVLQPDIAANPLNPDHLAAVVSTTSYAACQDQADCQLDLMLYTSTDGGETWAQQRPFTQARHFSAEGMVTFAPDGRLYVLGVRDGGVTLNWAEPESGYEMNRSRQKEVTRARVSARPWLQIDPDSAEFFLSYDAQYRDILASPSLNRSTDAGATWSFTARADQSLAIADIAAFRAAPPADIQVLPGQDDRLALVWTWNPDAWSWPRPIWLAASEDRGDTFSPPKQITETWGPISTAARNGNYHILYRPGTAGSQTLALATSSDGGQTWTSTPVSADIPLTFDVDKAPGLNIAPNGTLDIVFYAHTGDTDACALTVESWRETLLAGWTDTCAYDVYYTFSQDGGQTFSQPLRLNETPILGDRFVRLNGKSTAGSHIGMASTDTYAYPIWIETQESSGTQTVTARIER